jgi:outer membrane receptor protein involved in Fe transport
MSSGKYRILIYFVLLFALTVNIVLAGTTGKIAGRVVDKETGEPLIGMNVIVKGTSLGAATDIDGYYAILSVPPGIHTTITSMVGYSTVTVNEIRVLIDQTATVNVEMVSQAIEAGIVEVIAERHIVKKDVSSSISAIQPGEMEILPVTSINDMVSLQAGVEDGFVIRGGNASDMLLNVDGATQRDPRNNKPISNIALTSIQEVSIEKGGFAAEYGQARSGIVNIVQKEADVSHYSGSINVKYSPPQQKYFGMSVYDPMSMWNRPYMDPEVCWTGTNNGKWSTYQQNQYPSFGGWNVISQQLLTDNDPTNDLSPTACQRLYEYQHRRSPDTNSPDYNIDGSFGGPIPIIGEALGNLRFFASFIMNREMLLIPLSRPDYKDYNGSIKLNSDINNKTKLMLNASVGKSYNVVINGNDISGYYNQIWNHQQPGSYPYWSPTDFVRTPEQIACVTGEMRSGRIYDDSWYCPADVSDFSVGAKLTSMLSASTYYEISIQNQYRSYLTGPIAARDTNKNYELVPGYFVDEGPFGYSPSLGVTGIGDNNMFFGGWSSTARDSSKYNTSRIKGDITSQYTKEHMFKAGFEFAYYDLNINYGTINPYNDVARVKQHYNPYIISAYVQDKIEAYGFIANLGVRMDLSNPNTDWVDIDPFTSAGKAFYSSFYSDTIQYTKTRVKPQISFSPRLGISHPITESSKLYFNYGHFKQLPAYDEVFKQGRGAAGDMRNYGDPSLVQAKTVSYELGFDQSLFDTYLIQISAFYNDISDQQAFTYYTSTQKNITYSAANNNSYSDIRGLELTLRKSSGDWVRGFLSYTYQVVTLGQFGQVAIADNPADQASLDNSQANPLYLLVRQRPLAQPRANASITVLTPKNFAPRILGGDLLGDWSLNVIGTWKAGEWLTYNRNNATGIQNNVQVTDYFNINLRLNKTFSFKTFAVTIFMETNNLLNTMRLSGESFYTTDDYNAYMGSLHLPSNPGYSGINIPGDDRVGAYRTDDVQYQPVLYSGDINGINTTSSSFDPSAVYYDNPTGRYMNYVNGNWSEVDNNRMQKILNDKAYIDMPNNSSFNFLNPRQFFYGISLSFNL